MKCGLIIEKEEGLCVTCWPSIPFIVKPYCFCCGRPFDFEIEEGALCGVCSRNLPSYATVRSVFSYTEKSRDLILKFKHADYLSAAPLYGKWMVHILNDIKDPLCIPVPLHWTRLFTRTYNQAALLAREIAQIKGWTYTPSLLKRKKRTPSQGYLSKEERYKNVNRAFSVDDSKKILLKGKTILLVDDVFTTGATTEACAKTLLRAGAEKVHAVTLGRVVKPDL
ncbi:MAG: ComF family protein [Alphaproteobacteria bacterium]|nr:ComF family protein [Alphaproteobacteria bacterium]